MKRICAWCGAEMHAPEGREAVGVTHGLCARCRAESFSREKRKAQLPGPAPASEAKKELATPAPMGKP